MIAPKLAKGIDVSHHQGIIDWKKVKAAGVVFAFAKCTEGLHGADPRFQANWAGMKAAGLLRGAYHFFHSVEDGANQADWFLSHLPDFGSGDMPLVVDLEDTSTISLMSREILNLRIKHFVERVQEKTRHTPIIYTNEDYAMHLNADVAQCPLWLAMYALKPKVPEPWRAAGKSWSFWQYTEKGRVAGVNGFVDRSVVNPV